MHCTPCAFSFAFVNAGNSIAAKMAMIAMTTNNSISVNARYTRVDRERFTFMAAA